MADKSFDVVMVGGGSNNLITSMYLTKYGGLEVGIFEARHELGGGWCTEEPAGGYMANVCSTAMYSFYWEPVLRDIPEWEEYGARCAHTRTGNAMIFSEDQSCLVFYHAFDDADPTQELTAREIARFSEKDAETWLWLWEKAQKVWKPYVQEWLWNPARPFGVPDGLDKLVADPASEVDPLWLRMSPIQLYRELFESVEMRVAFCRPNQSLGINTSELGGGLFTLISTATYNPQHQYVIGGTHQLAHAAQRVIIENGGKVFTKHPVKNVIIENGKAKGVRLEDGTEIEARKAVVTEVSPSQFVYQMIGKEHLSERIMKRIDNLESWFINITWYTWCLKERPRYLAEAFNPDVWNSGLIHMTERSEEAIVRDNIERRLGMRPSRLHLSTVGHGWHEDDLLAPEGVDFTVLTEQFFLPAYALTEQEWKEFERTHAEEAIELWQKYAPNMTWDNVIGFNPVTPYYTANFAKNYGPAGNWAIIDFCGSQMGRCRPIPELANHRTPIKNLYASGAGWHPIAGAHGAQGYNCYKILAEDLGLRKLWEEKRRPW